jgi:excisionase family DNA binding protein
MAELTTKELAQRLGIARGTLDCWRSQGVGPAYRKYGGLVRYDESEVEEWRRQCQVIPSTRANVEERLRSLKAKR